MKNLDIIVTGDGRIEMVVGGAESFLLENNADSEMGKLLELLDIAARTYHVGGTCQLRMGEVAETA